MLLPVSSDHRRPSVDGVCTCAIGCGWVGKQKLLVRSCCGYKGRRQEEDRGGRPHSVLFYRRRCVSKPLALCAAPFEYPRQFPLRSVRVGLFTHSLTGALSIAPLCSAIHRDPARRRSYGRTDRISGVPTYTYQVNDWYN